MWQLKSVIELGLAKKQKSLRLPLVNKMTIILKKIVAFIENKRAWNAIALK